VILAVSLALIAVLVVTAGTRPRVDSRDRAPGNRANADAREHAPTRAAQHDTSSGSTTTSTAPPDLVGAPRTNSPSLSSSALGAGVGAGAGAGATHITSGGPGGNAATQTPPTTTTTTTTTTTSQGATAQPLDRSTQTQGVLDPPLQSSQAFAFTGLGPMEVSVVWSGNTYLTMVVSCANGNQSVGGSSAMQASLPDAQGSCRATVSEPSSESTALTFTITIGSAGG
jgi:hypothetical protein